MDINEVFIKKLIAKIDGSKERKDFLYMCKTGRLYYANENDIKRKNRKLSNHPLKTADNRISLNWHGLLVNQKAGYMFGREPTIDIGDEDVNRKIIKVLGDEWGKILKELTIEASNCSKAWLHYWIDSEGNFEYGKVPTEQISAIYSNDLKERLVAVLRRYIVNENDEEYTRIEYWTDSECHLFMQKKGNISKLNVVDDEVNSFIHNIKEVPFIYFNNNPIKKYDLYMYKDLVDKMDESISDFANDIDDVQEIIFVLEGYGGEELAEFMRDLKLFKAVKVDASGDVRTIRAEIPTEARKQMFTELKEAIFLFGMGVNPNKESLGDSSGVALKFLYSLLELKASATRTEFDCSIKILVRAILNYLGANNDQDISITYYKNMVTNDKEVVEILSKSQGIISDKTRTKNHPYTENLEDEIRQLEEDNKEFDEYAGLGIGDRNE